MTHPIQVALSRRAPFYSPQHLSLMVLSMGLAFALGACSEDTGDDADECTSFADCPDPFTQQCVEGKCVANNGGGETDTGGGATDTGGGGGETDTDNGGGDTDTGGGGGETDVDTGDAEEGDVDQETTDGDTEDGDVDQETTDGDTGDDAGDDTGDDTEDDTGDDTEDDTEDDTGDDTGDGGEDTEWTPPTGVYNPYVVAVTSESGPCGTRPSCLVFMQVNGTGFIAYAPSDIFNPSAPTWSPDGHYVAYTDSKIGSVYRRIVILDVETGETEELVPEVYQMQFIAWSPDGSGIAFAAKPDNGRDTKTDIYIYELATGRYNRITTTAVEESDVSWPHPNTVCYRRDQSLICQNLETGTEQTVISGAVRGRPSISWDLNYVAYERTEGTGTVLTVRDVRAGTNTTVPTPDGRAPGMAPSGTMFIFSGKATTGLYGLFTWIFDSPEPRYIPNLEFLVNDIAVSPVSGGTEPGMIQVTLGQ